MNNAVYFFSLFEIENINTLIQPTIKNKPPIGVKGPMNFKFIEKTSFKAIKYSEPENKKIPIIK